MAKHIYQDPVTKKKFSFDKKAERSNPDNNVRLIYVGEEGSASANEGIDVITLAKLTDIITKAESTAQLNTIMQMDIPKAVLADNESAKALSNLCAERMKILQDKEHGQEQEEIKKFKERQQIIANDITKKMYAAQTRKDLAQAYTPGVAIDGLSSDFAVKLNQLYQVRYDELGGG